MMNMVMVTWVCEYVKMLEKTDVSFNVFIPVT